MKSDADILAETREYITEHGWTRGTMQDPQTKKVCTLGGIVLSQGWMEEVDGAWHILDRYKHAVQRISSKVLQAIGCKVPDLRDEMAYEYVITGVTTWNDNQPSNAQQMVLDVLMKAEKVERNK